METKTDDEMEDLILSLLEPETREKYFSKKKVKKDVNVSEPAEAERGKAKDSTTASIYPPELMSLLQEFLSDGKISDKERKVLLKKAEKYEVDIDEFDLYIDAQEQKYAQQLESVFQNIKMKICPVCGTSISSINENCPSCGNFVSLEAVKELQERIDEIEENLKDNKYADPTTTLGLMVADISEIENNIMRVKMSYPNNVVVMRLMEKAESELKALSVERKRKEFIRTTIMNKWFWNKAAIVIGLLLIVGHFIYPISPQILLAGFAITAAGVVLYVRNKRKAKRIKEEVENYLNQLKSEW